VDPKHLGIDAQYAYWVYGDEPGLWRAPLVGGVPELVLPELEASAVRVVGERAYVVPTGSQRIDAIDLGSGAIDTIASTEGGIAGFTVDESHAYWTDYVGQMDLRETRAAAPLSGGSCAPGRHDLGKIYPMRKSWRGLARCSGSSGRIGCRTKRTAPALCINFGTEMIRQRRPNCSPSSRNAARLVVAPARSRSGRGRRTCVPRRERVCKSNTDGDELRGFGIRPL
jgi:hypothetical protein